MLTIPDPVIKITEAEHFDLSEPNPTAIIIKIPRTLKRKTEPTVVPHQEYRQYIQKLYSITTLTSLSISWQLIEEDIINDIAVILKNNSLLENLTLRISVENLQLQCNMNWQPNAITNLFTAIPAKLQKLTIIQASYILWSDIAKSLAAALIRQSQLQNLELDLSNNLMSTEAAITIIAAIEPLKLIALSLNFANNNIDITQLLTKALDQFWPPNFSIDLSNNAIALDNERNEIVTCEIAKLITSGKLSDHTTITLKCYTNVDDTLRIYKIVSSLNNYNCPAYLKLVLAAPILYGLEEFKDYKKFRKNHKPWSQPGIELSFEAYFEGYYNDALMEKGALKNLIHRAQKINNQAWSLVAMVLLQGMKQRASFPEDIYQLIFKQLKIESYIERNQKINAEVNDIDFKYTIFCQKEHSFDGKIGVYAINTNDNQIIAYRADERFPIQSTLKLIAVSALLKQNNSDRNLLEDKIHFTKNDLISWHPITGEYINSGMTLGALSAAAITYSDNPAANLIIKKLGGPKFITDFAHSIGNKTFNIEHYEGDLNSNPNNPDDTSTPKDMAISLQKLTLGNILPQPLRTQLVTWMTNNTTAYKRIRAGIPIGWTVADKTGSGDYGIANDIGILWSPACKPIVLAIYTVRNKENAKKREDIVAATTKIILDQYAKNDACFKALY